MAKIFLAGASGFIGLHILDKLVGEGHKVTCLLREESCLKIKKVFDKDVNYLIGEFSNTDSWIEHVKDHDIFINSIGIIRETKSSTFFSIHEESPKNIFKKCEEFDVKKVIQISALGADENAASDYHKTKKAADDYLKGLSLKSLVLRPSFVYGPGDTSMSAFSAMSGFPIHLLPSHGNFRISPIYISDLLSVVQRFINSDSIQKDCINIGGSTTVTLRDLFHELALLQGNKKFIQVLIPKSIISFCAKLTDLLGFGPITSDEWSMLRRENYCTTEDFKKFLGREPLSLSEGLARSRMHTNSYDTEILKLILPFLRASVAFIWIFTGLISAFLVPEEYSLKLLDEIGLHGNIAKISLYFSSILEVILGILILKSSFINFITLLQLGMIIFFSFTLSFSDENFWLHPFGPLSKNIPLMGAIVTLWALERIFNRGVK